MLKKYDCPQVFRSDGTKDPLYVQAPWQQGLHATNVRYEPAVYAVTPKSVTRDSTCIAMTRALGDFYAHQFGLTWVPTVNVYEFGVSSARTSISSDASAAATAAASSSSSWTDPVERIAVHTLPPADNFTVIIASDGVWDCWRYEDLHAYCNDLLTKRGMSIADAGRLLLDESIRRAVTSFGARHYDDASLVMWQMGSYDASSPLSRTVSSP